MKIKKCDLLEELSLLHRYYFPGEYQIDEGVKYLDRAVPNRLRSAGRINMTGHKINSLLDLADLFTIFKDERYETMRWVIMKDDEIVGTLNVTSKLPAKTSIIKHYNDINNIDTDYIRMIAELKRKIVKLNATGYYLFHNHPTGDPTPSQLDLKMLEFTATKLEGCLGSIILGAKEFSYTKPDSIDITKFYPLTNATAIPATLTKDSLTTPTKIANYAKNYYFSDKTSLIMYLDAKLRLTAVEEVDNGEFNSDKIYGHIFNEIRNNGSDTVMLVTNNINIAKKLPLAPLPSPFRDIIYIANNEVVSMSAAGKLGPYKFDKAVKRYNV